MMAMLDFLAHLNNANIARDHEWDPNSVLDLSFFGNELAGEVGEACNIIKKLERERLGLRGSRATKQQLGEELADVVIVVSIIAGKLGLDLKKEIIEKFNKTSTKNNFNVFL